MPQQLSAKNINLRSTYYFFAYDVGICAQRSTCMLVGRFYLPEELLVLGDIRGFSV